ncbi:MAG: hypothetical protein L3J13_02955 [Devosiaceae bacterium]|nr:hypothetical protein [Devosiaceae bacterium]
MELKNFLKGLFYKIAALLFVAGAAQATQNTQFQPLGYSEQGRYFAYEEYGLDEQSGHGFSTIYITDLIQVSHVVGTPITFEAPIDELSLLAIREQALIKAKVFLNSPNLLCSSSMPIVEGTNI